MRIADLVEGREKLRSPSERVFSFDTWFSHQAANASRSSANDRDHSKCTSTGLDPKPARFVVQVHGEELLKKKLPLAILLKAILLYTFLIETILAMLDIIKIIQYAGY